MASAKERQSQVPKDYDQLRLSPNAAMLAFIVFAAGGALLMFIFYQNPFFAMLGLLLGFLGPRYERQRRIAERKRRLSMEFKDMLYALSSSIGAGMELTNALHAASRDLSALYFDPDTLILLEIRHIIGQVGSGMPVHEAFGDLARRSHDPDIQSLADVLRSTHDSGVDLARLIKRTAAIITEKIEVQQEIQTNVASMKMEQKILCAMPVLLMLFINLGATDYMAPLYASPLGYGLITLALALLGAAIWVSNRIMNIKL